jgi:hypothetical protein
MRSTAAGHRRRSRPTPGARLGALTRLLTETRIGEDRHLAFHVVDLGEDVDLGLLELPAGVHPFEELAGTVAPPEWDVFGLVVQGRARHLDDEWTPTSTTFTYAVDRAGHEASAGLLEGEVVDLPGRPVGTIPDLCRRILGRPTAPAPPSTALLWATQWLAELQEQWQQPDRRRLLTTSWPAVASLHPAAGGELLLDPDVLVARARAWTASRSWEALRHGPAFELPDGPLPSSIAAWMDDGFFARWTIGGYPSLPYLFAQVLPLLDQGLRAPLTDLLVALLDDGLPRD